MKIRALAKVVFGLLVLLLFTLIFFPFVIPGIVLGLVFRNSHPGTISAFAGLILVVVYRILNGEWTISFGPVDNDEVLFEIFGVAVSWAIGTFLLMAGFNIPVWIAEGYRATAAAKRLDAAPGETLEP